MVLLTIALLLSSVLIVLYYRAKIKKLFQQTDSIEKLDKDIQQQEQKLNELLQQRKESEHQCDLKKRQLRSLQEEISNNNEVLNTLIQDGKSLAEQQIESEITLIREKRKKELEEEFQRLVEKNLEEEKFFLEQKKFLEQDISNYERKRAAIIEATKRENEIEANRDFYSLKLRKIDKEDIEYLLSIERNINNKEVLRKLIWATYLQQPLRELHKRIFSTDSVCGVYKITDSLGRVYIGKSTDVKKRHQEHVKASLGIGTISNQLIHEALKEQGWDTFTWELLEECSREELNDREKYYITFYDSVGSLGYNMKKG